MAANWITLSQSAGTGNATVTFTASYNGSSVSARSATLRFKVSGQTIDVQINQAKKPAVIDYLLIDGPYSYYIPYSGGSVTSANVRSEIVVYAHYDDHPVGQGFVDVTSAATITISPNDYTCGVNTSFDEYGEYLGTFNVDASYSGISTSNSPSVYQDAVPDSRKIVYSGTSLIGIENSDDLHNGDDSTTVLATVFNSTSGLGMFIVDKDITYLPYRLFAEESGVTAINIPSTVSGWNESCFLRCRNLTTVNGLENLAQLSFRVGGNVNGYQFYDCNGLTHVGLPASLPCNSDSYSLPYKMFGNCSSLTTLIYSGTMAQFDALKKQSDWRTGSALRYIQCSDGTIDLDPPQNDTIIYYATEQLNISNTATTPSFTSHTFSNGVGTIKASGDITGINELAFNTCTGMTNIFLPNTVESIGRYAFYYCSSLTGITIPDSVTVLDDYVFYGCTGLTSINIPTGITSIPDSTFSKCSSLVEITIPSSVTEIDRYAFYLCYSLTGITIPSSVTEIGEYAFYDCFSLTGITIPSSVTEIGQFAFAYCSDLITINYSGTMAQWENIGKGISWHLRTPATVVHCTDGDVPI